MAFLLLVGCLRKPANIGFESNRWRTVSLMLLAMILLSGCTRLFFVPSRTMVQNPNDIGFEYEDVFLTTADDTRVHAWLIQPTLEPGQRPLGLVYFLHGNAQNISWHLAGAQWALEAGYEVFALSYRGYGRSLGYPNVPHVYMDIDAGFDWLMANPQTRTLIDSDAPLVLFGQSLGASLGFNWLAGHSHAQESVTHVIADSGFARFGTVAREIANSHWLTWSFQYPAQWFLLFERDPVESIGQINRPILIIHGELDAVVRYQHSEVLLASGGENTGRISFLGQHIAGFRDPEVLASVLDWLGHGG